MNTMGKCDAALLTTFPYHSYGHASSASSSVASVPPQTEEVTFLCAATYRTRGEANILFTLIGPDW